MTLPHYPLNCKTSSATFRAYLPDGEKYFELTGTDARTLIALLLGKPHDVDIASISRLRGIGLEIIQITAPIASLQGLYSLITHIELVWVE